MVQINNKIINDIFPRFFLMLFNGHKYGKNNKKKNLCQGQTNIFKLYSFCWVEFLMFYSYIIP